MAERRFLVDAKGRRWTLTWVKFSEAEEEDLRFWYEELSPEERVAAVSLLSCLKTRVHALPRLRRVHRRIKCPWRSASDRASKG
jgi:hypothetical protein